MINNRLNGLFAVAIDLPEVDKLLSKIDGLFRSIDAKASPDERNRARIEVIVIRKTATARTTGKATYSPLTLL